MAFRGGSNVRIAAGVVLVAEVGHLRAILLEWPHWLLRGVFHTAAAVALGVLAASLLVGPGRRTLLRGAVLTLLLPALWLFTRTLGFPSLVTLHRLPVGVLDTLTSAVEIIAAVLIVAELRRRADPSPTDARTR